MSRIRMGVVAAVAPLLPAVVTAQPRLRLDAGLELAERYDDNLFTDPGSRVRKSDVVYRVGPRLGLAYRARTLSVVARYGRDGEVFGLYRQLNSTKAHQDAALEMRWSPAGALTLEAAVLYADTMSARDLNLAAPFEAARLPASRFSARGSLSLRLGRLTRLRAEHGFDGERTSGYPDVEVQTAGVTLERTFGRSDTASLGFMRREFDTADDAMRSHRLVVGWSRQVTPSARFEITAGPRLSDGGTVGPEVSATLSHGLRRGDVILVYTQSEATAAGSVGPIAVSGVTAMAYRHFSRGVRIGGGPGIFTGRRKGLEATVYRANAELEWRLARRLALTATYVCSLQQGSLTGSVGQDIPHNIVSFRLVAGSAGILGRAR